MKKPVLNFRAGFILETGSIQRSNVPQAGTIRGFWIIEKPKN
jgi:hypothetical protein